MDEQMREKMVAAFEKTVHAVGSKDYETAMKQASAYLEFMHNIIELTSKFLQSSQTIEGLRKTLDSLVQLPENEEAMLLSMFENLPMILRIGLTAVGKKAASTLPPPSGGRKPAFTARQSQEALDYVSQLNRKGTPMAAAKQRAAQKFQCGRRTIERLWANRESIPLENQPTIQELLTMLFKQGAADGWQMPQIEWTAEGCGSIASTMPCATKDNEGGA